MRDDRFEWDDRKAASNLRKHGVSFEMARLAFSDLDAIEDLDETDDEERIARIGLAGDRLLLVIFTMRDPRIRIISVRKAKRDEELRYFSQFQ